MVELSPAVARPIAVPRFAALDALRFVAALAVMAFHYTASSAATWPFSFADVAPPLFWLTKFGYYGVDLFFVISGFVILMSAWEKPVEDFAASRISRLYPAYWAGVVLTGALLLATKPASVSVSQILINLTMAQSAFGVEHVDGVYWTLWVELHFYILIGVFLLIGITRARLLVFAVAWPLVASIAEASDAHLVSTFLQPTYAPLFAGGMLLYLLTIDGRSPLTWLLLAADVAWTFPTAGTDAAEAIKRLTGAGLSSPTMILVTTACFGLVALVALSPLRRLRWTWLTTAGLLTYPLYLVHEQFGWALIAALGGSLPWPAVLAAAVAMSLALAVLVHRFVERPFGRRLRTAIRSSLPAAPVGRRNAHQSRAE